MTTPTEALKLARCPECYRPKARNADDCMAGCCSKWYAVRDTEAADECKNLAAYWRRAALAQAEQPAEQAQPVSPKAFRWPGPPPRSGQSPVLFDDGYVEGWAKCIDTLKGLLVAPPAAQPVAPLPEIDDDDRRLLHDSPNTSDIVAWVQDYARKAISAQQSAPTPLTEQQFCASLPADVARSFTPAELDLYERGFRHAEKVHNIGTEPAAPAGEQA